MALYTRIKGPVGYTTIGSPTMTDGIATGFSSSNYYKLDTPFLPGNNAWEIVIRAKFNNLTARHTLISYAASNTKSVQLTTTVNGTLVTYLSSNGTSTNIAQAKTSTLTVQANTWYYFRIRFTKTAYEISVSEDRQVWTTYITVNSSTPVWQGAYLSIGYNYSQYPEPMDGYIDFNNSYIQIEDTAFWGYSVSRAKIRTNPFVKYEVVGNPTIVDGVVSGFSTSPRADIVTSSMFVPSNNFEIAVSVNTKTLQTNRNQWFLSSLGNNRRNICWGVAGASKKIRIYLSSNGSSWDIASSRDGTHVLSNNTDYKLKLVFNGSSYVVYILIDNVWVEDILITSSVQISSQILRFGNNESGRAHWPGSIDLNNTYIKNGQYWFNGAMQNVETWTPHIKDN